jgi:alpha-galactosidase
VAEFFPHFLHQGEAMLPYGLQGGLNLTNHILEGKGALRANLAAQAEGLAPLDADLLDERRERWQAVGIMEAMLLGRERRELAVNLRNDGLIPNLPAEAVVEAPALVDATGVHGVPVGPLPRAIADILRARVAQQERTVDAALLANRDLALHALLADPLVRGVERAAAMLDESLQAQARYLPDWPVRAPAA